MNTPLTRFTAISDNPRNSAFNVYAEVPNNPERCYHLGRIGDPLPTVIRKIRERYTDSTVEIKVIMWGKNSLGQ